MGHAARRCIGGSPFTRFCVTNRNRSTSSVRRCLASEALGYSRKTRLVSCRWVFIAMRSVKSLRSRSEKSDCATMGPWSHADVIYSLRIGRWKNRFPVVFHADHGPTFGDGFVPCFIEFADERFAIVSPLALGVGMMHKTHET